MSVSLDDIWSEPLADSAPAPPRQSADVSDDDADDVFRPAKRRCSSLFLDDPDEQEELHSIQEHAKQSHPSITKGSRPEVDYLFDDLDDPRQTNSAPKPYDLAALRREAQLRAEKEVPPSSFTKYAVQSSSPPRDGLGGDDALGRNTADDGGKKRRPLPKLDETRLLGKDGLPALIPLCKDFKPKGKGHELSDLNRLFSIYQFWSHKMYPKTQFNDTVNRVEKLCHQKRLLNALGVWRDECNGTVHGKNIRDNIDEEMHSDDNESRSKRDDDVLGPMPTSSPASASSRTPPEVFEPSVSQPPSSASDPATPTDDDDLFDLSAVLALEEVSRANTSASSRTAYNIKSKRSPSEEDYNIDDNDELWAEFGNLPSAYDVAPAPRPPIAVTISNASNPSTSASQRSLHDFDDEDAWDALENMEKEREVATKGGTDMSPLQNKKDYRAPVSYNHDTASATNMNDNDLDDMYVDL